MEFLRLVRHHFVGKPLVVSQNVGCFLRLSFGELAQSLVKYINKHNADIFQTGTLHPRKTPWAMLVFRFASYTFVF